MSLNVSVSVIAQGEDFSPSKWEAELGISCRYKTEKGEPIELGPSKGKPKPFGTGAYFLDSENWAELFTGSQPEYWKHLKAIIDSARSLGAVDINLYVVIEYPDQCNLSFDISAFKYLAELGVPMDISAYIKE